MISTYNAHGEARTRRESDGPPEQTERDRLRDSFALTLEAEGASAATRRVYGYAVRTLFNGLDRMGPDSLPTSAITAEHIRHVLAEKQRGGSSPGTMNTIHRGLRRFFAWLQAEAERVDNPMQKIAAPAVPEKLLDIPSREQIEALIAHCRKDRRKVLGARDAAIIMVLATTGLRAAELCALQVGDIDINARLAVVTGKRVARCGQCRSRRPSYGRSRATGG